MENKKIIFRTKIVHDAVHNGQEVCILEYHPNGYNVLVRFPDGVELWVFTSELFPENENT